MKDFKQATKRQKVASNPALHFLRKTARELPDVMPHQKEILETYAQNYQDRPDVALQLPTGSGKTLVGLLIADWRMLKYGEKVLYLCPTKQLVKQTVLQAQERYGIGVVDLSGKKKEFPPADVAAYRNAEKVAISTYSGLFNSQPFFTDPNLIVVDDTHAAENYIARLWSMQIGTTSKLHQKLADFLRDYVSPQDYARLTGDWLGGSDATWVEKIPSPTFFGIKDNLHAIIETHFGESLDDVDRKLFFGWQMLKNNLHACQMYLGSREILIRPLIPPSFSHSPFANARQRLFMSATLGIGGDLERLTGIKKIERIPAPSGVQSTGVGRRLFIFPHDTLTSEETFELQVKLQKLAGRSVILTPSDQATEECLEKLQKKLPNWAFVRSADIEANKKPFTGKDNCVAILSNRYDGIDFPKEECRLLILDGLPQATNIQENFILSKMGALVLYDERIKTRVFQATGRCTRALEDRSAVLITDSKLNQYLTDPTRIRFFHPELQSEIEFGKYQSKEVALNDLVKLFEGFKNNDADWAKADNDIREDVVEREQITDSCTEELSSAVQSEIDYQKALWYKHFPEALQAAEGVLDKIKHRDLRGYRALWHYLAGSANWLLSQTVDAGKTQGAMWHFSEAKKAAPNVSWLSTLSRNISRKSDKYQNDNEMDTEKQVIAIEQMFVKLGSVSSIKFEKRSSDILSKLNSASTFEWAHKELGSFLGFLSKNGKGDATPDCWWLAENIGVVFEDHAGGAETTSLGAEKARQAANHTKWLNETHPVTKNMKIVPVIVTPCVRAMPGAFPQLDGVKYWNLEEFRIWARNATSVMRHLKGLFHQEGDLVWRMEATEALKINQLSIDKIVSHLPNAKETLKNT